MRRWLDWDGVLPPKGDHLIRQSGWMGKLDATEYTPEVFRIFQRAEALAVEGALRSLGAGRGRPLAPGPLGLEEPPQAGACTAAHVAYVVVAEVLGRLGASAPWGTDVPSAVADLREAAAAGEGAGEGHEESSGLAQLLRAASAQRPNEPGPVEFEDLCGALFEPSVGLSKLLEQNGFTKASLTRALGSLYRYDAPAPGRPGHRPPRPAAGAGTNAKGGPRDWNERADPFGALTAGGQDEEDDEPPALERFGRDLVAAAAEGKLDPVLGRDKEVDRVLRVLARRNKPNVCLLGQPGVGKTAVVEEVARRVHEGRVPSQLKGCKKLVQLSLGSLVGGTRYRGEFEQRMQSLLKEIYDAGDEVILFIDEIHMALGAGETEKGGSMDAANLLKPALARGELRCIGATTTAEYKKVVQGRDKAFERRFVVVELDEPSEEIAEQMLEGLLPAFERHHDITVQRETLRAAVYNSRMLRGRFLPDRALDILDDAATLASVERTGTEADGRPVCTPEHTRRAAQETAMSGGLTLRQRLENWLRPRSRL